MVLRSASRATQGPVLEAMCGSGRLLVPLVATATSKCTASTRRPRCSRAAKRGSPRAATEHVALPPGRRRSSNLPFRYGAAFIAGGAFQLITDPAGRALRSSASARISSGPAASWSTCYVPAAATQRLGRAARRGAHGQARRTARRSRCASETTCIDDAAPRATRDAATRIARGTDEPRAKSTRR